MMTKLRLAAGLSAAFITTGKFIAAVSAAALFAFPAVLTSAASEDGGWTEVMETIHHDEEGHYENQKTGEAEVVDKKAWDEQIKHYYYECAVCLFRDETEDGSLINDHILREHPTGNGNHYYDPVDGDEIYPSYREKYEIEIIHHDAETHMEDIYEDVWIVDRKAYDEEVPTGLYGYVIEGEFVRNAAVTIDGRIFPFDDDGIVRIGQWVTVGNDRYHTDETGAAMTGWQVLGGRKYYFRDERYRSFREADRGKMMTGWANIGNRTYYFADGRYPAYSDSKKGIMLSGWKTISGRKYYFMDSFYSEYDESQKGILLTGFRKINGKTYYLTDKRAAGYKDWKRGILLSGHVTVGGKRYFLTKTGVVVKKQFATLNGEKYYFSNDGTMLRNSWITVNGRKFYLEKSGKMHKGLLTLNGKKYYFGWNGVLVVNRWITADGKRYYADGSGELEKQY